MPARQAFALARTIVVPSRAEAMPYIVLEALAAGMPMIATAVGGIPEIFVGREHLLVATGSRFNRRENGGSAWPILKHFRAEMPPRAELRARFGADVMAAAASSDAMALALSLMPAIAKPKQAEQSFQGFLRRFLLSQCDRDGLRS